LVQKAKFIFDDLLRPASLLQIGDGTTAQRLTPVDVLSNVSAVAAGYVCMIEFLSLFKKPIFFVGQFVRDYDRWSGQMLGVLQLWTSKSLC
jgi:hypothetical protein